MPLIKALSDFLKIYAARLLAGTLGLPLAAVIVSFLRSVSVGVAPHDPWSELTFALWFLLLVQSVYSLISGVLFYVLDALWVLFVGGSATSNAGKGVRAFLMMLALDLLSFFVEHGIWLVRREGISGLWNDPSYNAKFLGVWLTAALFVFFYSWPPRRLYMLLCVCVFFFIIRYVTAL